MADARRHLRVLRAEARKLLKVLDCDSSELSVLLTGDRRIHQLNRDFRRKNRPTDVLSFAQIDALDGVLRADTLRPGPFNVLGDVVISVETAARQAAEIGQSIERRIRALMVHGVLHLLGYDHERSAADAKKMFACQAELEEMLESGPRRAGRHPRRSATR